MKTAFGMVFVLVCGFFMAPLSSAAEQVQGNLQFNNGMMHDFGRVQRGQKLTHRFAFTNAGDGMLSIQGVHAACGCTVANIDQGRKYRPGESDAIEVSFDTADFVGPVVKTITILTNQRLSPDRILTLKAFVNSQWEAQPPLADFGQVLSQDGAEQKISIRPLEGFKLELKGLSFNDQFIDAAIVPASGREYQLTIKIKPGTPPGFLKETLTVRSNSNFLREMSIPIRAHIKGLLDYSPLYLEFGVIPKAEVMTRSVVVSGAADFEIKKTRIEMIINGQRVEEILPVAHIDSSASESQRKTVSLQLKNQGNYEGSVHGKLFVETTDSHQQQIVVDFYAFFR